MIWFKPITVAEVNFGFKYLPERLGIEVVEVGDDFIKARMPVDERTWQPYGLLHGGASVALAETLASVAGVMCVDRTRFQILGQEINANHLRAMKNGFVYGVARPIHLGGRSQVWDIRISDEKDRLVCISRMTAAVVEIKA